MKTIRLLPIPLLFALVSCGSAPPAGHQAQSPAPVAAHASAAAMETWPSRYEATGTVRARVSAPVSAQVMAAVREVLVQAGDRVRQGQLLVRLDSRDLEAAELRAQAGLQEVRSAVPEADNGVASAKANLDLAQVTDSRIEELFGKKSVSRQERDESGARLKAARAAYAMAESRRAQIDARIAQAEQEVKAAAVTRGYAEIRAPFDGTVTARSVEPGAMAVPGATLLTIERAGAFRLEAPVEESMLSSIRLGSPVQVALDGGGAPVETKVTEIVPAVEAASRSYLVKIDLPPIAAVRSGMFGRAVFPIGTRQVLAVPAGAVITRGQLESVFTADQNTARLRLVTLGVRHDDRVEILSGLQAGDRVINPVPAGLADGTPVEERP